MLNMKPNALNMKPNALNMKHNALNMKPNALLCVQCCRLIDSYVFSVVGW